MALDLFGVSGRRRPSKKQRSSPPFTPWRDLLPMRVTSGGIAYTDHERAERMATALAGEPSVAGARFLELFFSEMAEGRVALRVFALRGASPRLVPGTQHLSCRSSQRARDLLNGRSEARGLARLPFRSTFPKEVPPGALRHGHLIVERGFDMALVQGPVHRAALESWPVLDTWNASDEPAHRGCPLILGNATPHASWTHLASCPGAGLAVWPSGSLLWLFKVVPGHTFPALFAEQPLYTEAAS